MKVIIKFMFSLYSFVFSIFRKYYYGEDIDKSYFHSMVIMTCLLFFPVIGLIFSLGIYLGFGIIPFPSEEILVRKLILIPIVLVLFLINILILKKIRKNRKTELEQYDFNTLSLAFKFKMSLIILLLFWSVLWMPILTFELFMK